MSGAGSSFHTAVGQIFRTVPEPQVRYVRCRLTPVVLLCRPAWQVRKAASRRCGGARQATG
jgi:hypothetical protein